MEKEKRFSLSECADEAIKFARQYEQRLWELYCINVKNGMLAPDAYERAKAYLEYYMKSK